MNRRQFLQKGASALALTSLASSFPAFAASDGKPLRVGLIGTGWYGKCDLLRLLQVTPAEVVSLCDVDRRMLNNAADIVAGRQESGNRPRTYHDYREMLAEKDLDLVLVATPDHWHALPMIEAVKAGADVYVQKPISIDVEEGRAMLAAARKHERVVQVGTQRRSTPHLIDAKDKVIKEGLLGDIAFVEIYC
ncbi:MAG: Gfo/Idh/MocA family oxidoreductase, partial [Verrucomicrobiota bacterium]|nr:Gfo/Idh/MocA family oxidoreductase [Verrucomicrobiota bacterium]